VTAKNTSLLILQQASKVETQIWQLHVQLKPWIAIVILLKAVRNSSISTRYMQQEF
jgi:hypothetical protein